MTPTAAAPDGFQRLADLAAAAFDAPLAVVSRIEANGHGFHACVGMDADLSIPREASFCTVAVEAGEPLLIVPDTHRDPRFKGFPNVVGAPGLRFYAGAVFGDASGRPVGVVAVLDTTPRAAPDTAQRTFLRRLAALAGDMVEAAERARSDARRLEMLELAESMAGVGHFYVDMASGRVTWSDEVYRIHGFSPGAVDPTEYSRTGPYHPDDAEHVRGLVQEALRTGGGYDARLRLTRPDGEVRITRAKARCEHDAAGRAAALFGVFQDVTDAVRADESLAQSESLYRLMNETATDVIARYTPDGTFLHLSPSIEAVLGHAPADLIGRNCAEIIHRDDRAATFAAMAAAADAPPDARTHVEYRAVRADGSVTWLEASPRLIRDPQGRVIEVHDHVRDIGRRKAAEREQAEMVEMLKLAEQVAGVGHWRLDVESQRVSWSEEVYRIHGVDRTDFDPNLNASIDFYHPDDRATVQTWVARALQTGACDPFQLRLIRADGALRQVSSRGVVQRDEAGRAVALFGVFQDVTDQKALEAALTEARDRAEEAARVKSEFLANMSHELRTPLTSVIGFAGLLQASETLDPLERRYADRIGTASEALLSVINDILDYSKLGAGAVEMDPQPFDARAWAAGAVDLVEGQCLKKGLGVTLSVDDALPATLVGDEGRLRQVLLNFLSNACKFTAQGEIAVEVGWRAGRLRAQVTDSGVGVAPERIDALFDRFTQADLSTTRTYGGTGLGLAICRRLIELMGGRIGATSRPGEGSTFWFEAPLPVASAPGAALSPADQGVIVDPVLPPARILLADDAAANRELIGALLRGLGLDVETVGDGAEAVEALRRGGHDLVLMDVHMPGMDGLAATRAIRALPGPLGATPVVALTANVQPEHVRRCLDAGLDGHVGKPVSMIDLVAALRLHLAARPGRTTRPSRRKAA